jgi:hypothetical protein
MSIIAFVGIGAAMAKEPEKQAPDTPAVAVERPAEGTAWAAVPGSGDIAQPPATQTHAS